MMPIKNRTQQILLALFLVGSSFAQGDTCSDPAVFIYVGGHTFTTEGLTQSNFEVGSGCEVGAQNAFWADGFITWYVPFSANFQFDTNSTPWDTQLAIYDQPDCSALCLGSDDNSGQGQASLLRLPGLSAGQIILIQIGGAGMQEGAGLLTISTYALPCGPNSEDPFEDNDDCSQALPWTNGTFPALYVERSDKDHFATCLAPGATGVFGIDFPHAHGDLDLFLWDAADPNCGSGVQSGTPLAQSTSTTDGEWFLWTNPSSQFIDVILEVSLAPGSQAECNSYGLFVDGTGCLVGATFCSPTNNSLGRPTQIGGITGWASGLHLEAFDGPVGEFGMFLVGDSDTSPGLMVSHGFLCLAGVPGARFFRYNGLGGGPATNSLGRFDGSGLFQNLSASSVSGFGFDVPVWIPGYGPIQAGETSGISSSGTGTLRWGWAPPTSRMG